MYSFALMPICIDNNKGDGCADWSLYTLVIIPKHILHNDIRGIKVILTMCLTIL